MIKVTYYDNRHDCHDEEVDAIRALYLLDLYNSKRWVVDLEMTINGVTVDCNKLIRVLKF